MTTFIDFWLKPVLPCLDLIDHRATAEAELDAFLKQLNLGEERPLVFLNGDTDWLAPNVPPEWIADMLETIARYPSADYCLFSFETSHWQSRVKGVAKLQSPGGRIALDWLDHRPPAGLHLMAPSPHEFLLMAIPQAPPRKRDPGVLLEAMAERKDEIPATYAQVAPLSRRMPLPHLGR